MSRPRASEGGPRPFRGTLEGPADSAAFFSSCGRYRVCPTRSCPAMSGEARARIREIHFRCFLIAHKSRRNTVKRNSRSVNNDLKNRQSLDRRIIRFASSDSFDGRASFISGTLRGLPLRSTLVQARLNDDREKIVSSLGVPGHGGVFPLVFSHRS